MVFFMFIPTTVAKKQAEKSCLFLINANYLLMMMMNKYEAFKNEFEIYSVSIIIYKSLQVIW